jgi:transcriptional regulator
LAPLIVRDWIFKGANNALKKQPYLKGAPMYIPNYYQTPAQETLLKIWPQSNFAELITADENGVPQASHLPFSYDPTRGEFGTLYGHVARANPHWKLFGGAKSLIIFSGPHDYVSPRYYASSINVPTWNYVAVHAYGPLNIIEEPAEVLSILKRLTDEHEAGADAPWRVEDFEEKRLHAMMQAIVAFEMPVTELQAKAKLGQNKKPEDREAVAKAITAGALGAWQRDVI